MLLPGAPPGMVSPSASGRGWGSPATGSPSAAAGPAAGPAAGCWRAIIASPPSSSPAATPTARSMLCEGELGAAGAAAVAKGSSRTPVCPVVALPKATSEPATALASLAASRARSAVPLIWIIGASGEVTASIRADSSAIGTPVLAAGVSRISGWLMIRPYAWAKSTAVALSAPARGTAIT
ncbi:hypothetical protein GXW82_42200 [Streptacidiphilus sp. 4-A2]|nr:hypothetical protein [Streptacidiphilus sp. 4-A2]